MPRFSAPSSAGPSPAADPLAKPAADPAANAAAWAGHPKGSAAYRRILAGLAFAGVATFAQLYSTQAVLPLLASDLKVSAAEAALTISLATVGLALTVLPWSFLADRIGRVRAMMWGISAATILGLLVPLASSFPVLLCLRTLEGMALGGIPAIAIAYLNEEVNKAHAALAAGSYVAGTTLGGLAGRLVAGPVGELWGWRAAALAVSVLATGAAVLFLVLVPRAQGFTAAAAAGFRGAMSTLAGHARNPRLLALYIQAFLLMGGFVAVYNYLGFRLSGEPFSLPATAISLIFLAYLSGTVSARWAAGLTSRFGRRTVLIAGTALMAGGLALTLTQLLALILIGLAAVHRRLLRGPQHRFGLDRRDRHDRSRAGRLAVQPRLLPRLQRARLGRRPDLPGTRMDGPCPDRHRTGRRDGGSHRRRASRVAPATGPAAAAGAAGGKAAGAGKAAVSG